MSTDTADHPTASPSNDLLTSKSKLWAIWRTNKGMLYVLLSNIIGAIMDATARFLQQTHSDSGSGPSFHPFQIIVVRMGVTGILSSIVMCVKCTPDFPLGQRAVRGWLLLRALFGYGGLICLYYSVRWLPLAEATVMRFLVPIVTAWACYVFLGQEFTWRQVIAGVVALVGVVIIAHPGVIFGDVDDDDGVDVVGVMKGHGIDHVSPGQRMLAIVIALLGVLGASGAYTSIRIIGSRAHPLISVNYFSLMSTAGSAIALSVVPGIGWVMPSGARDWMLLAVMGLLGFALQYLLTTGLTVDKSPRATSMLYTQVLFALMFDWAIWGVLPGVWSVVGGVIVVVSTLWVALQKGESAGKKEAEVAPRVVDEETALLGGQARGLDEGVTKPARSLQ